MVPPCKVCPARDTTLPQLAFFGRMLVIRARVFPAQEDVTGGSRTRLTVS